MPSERSDSPRSGGEGGNRATSNGTTRPSSSGVTAASNNNSANNAATSKPKRVRTGCLTCRERHLKCDEALPNCMNCRKSARVCKRGVRLNFIDTQCHGPPVTAPLEDGARLSFMDESRDIASEYKGGLAKYSRVEVTKTVPIFETETAYDYAQPPAPSMSHQPLPSIQGMLPEEKSNSINGHDVHGHYQDPSLPSHSNAAAAQYMDNHGRHASTTTTFFEPVDVAPQYQHPGSGSSTHSHPSMMSQRHHHHQHQQQQHHAPQQQYHQHQQRHQSHGSQSSNHQQQASGESDDANEAREILGSADETLYMQVFVEEVGLWMDTMDPMKHFSELLPFHALNRPMLLNAFLACGVRHLTLVNPLVYKEEKALDYYDKASRYLLRALENPERDSVICATTAVILNVYEIMTEKALPRMNHIAGARALIKECGWNAKSTGIGAACFWLNVGLETLSNLHFKWQASWPPDQWGLELDLEKEVWPGREEIWTHRMLYIIAKIGDYRANDSKPGDDSSPLNEQTRRQQRWNEWSNLKHLCDTWSNNIPRTMQPMAYLYPYQTTSKSRFPEVWLIKRTTIIARLFYHTAMVLLAQTNPIVPHESAEMKELELHHAHQICGIVAHVKDRGVASVAIRSLAHAAECLTSRPEQEEVLQIFTKIHKETGWRIGFIPQDLRKKWGWGPDDAAPPMLPTHENPSQGRSGGMMKGSPYQFDQYGEYQRLQQGQAQAQARAAAAAAAAAERRTSLVQQQQQQQQQQHHLQQRQQVQQTNGSPNGATNSPSATASSMTSATQRGSVSSQGTSPRRPVPPQGIVNPLLGFADFSLSKHPYQDNYVAPAHHHAQNTQQPGLGLGLPPMTWYAPPQAAAQYPAY